MTSGSNWRHLNRPATEGARTISAQLIRPLLQSCNTSVFSLILITFNILEETLTAMWHGKAVSIAIGGGSLQGILVVGIIMFVALMPFFALKEIGRDIGDGKLYELFFIRRTKYTPQQSLSSK